MSRRQMQKIIKRIPLDQVNEPKFLVRENMGTAEELAELGASLREQGQIQAIVVFRQGDRYELIAGHRRVYAARLAGMLDLWAEIVEGTIEQFSMMRYQENKQRLNASPYEEACFLKEMLTNLGCSQVELAHKLGISAANVAQRLAILDGYPEVREALRVGLINFSQCRELMLFPDAETAKQYLDITVRGGAKAELLRQWRSDINLAYKKVEQTDVSEEEADQARKMVQLQLRTCEVCSTVIDPIDIVYMKVCHICEKTLKQSIEKFRK